MIRKCKVEGHQNNQIVYICFQDSCVSRRVCCSTCMDNHNRNHSNWALLNPPYQFLINKIAKHKKCSQGEYIRTFIEIITQKRKKMITQLKEFTKKQQQKLEQLSNFVVGMLLGDNIEKQIKNISLQASDKQIQNFVKKVNLCNDPHISNSKDLLLTLKKISQGNFGEEHLIDNIYDNLNKIQQSFESSSLFNETTNWKQMVQSYNQPYQPRRQLDLLMEDMKQEGWEKLNQLVNRQGKEIFKIKQLNLHQQKLRKIIKLNSFQNLEELNLGFNCIKKIQNIGISNLIKLNLESNSIQKIQNLSSLINLQQLNFDSNKIVIIENVEKLHKLRQLYLCNNKIKKIENLTTLQNLQILHLGANQITTIENLNNLISLTSLRLNNNLIKNYDRLPEISKLNDIALYDNPQFSQTFKEQMRRLSTSGIRILGDFEI